LRSTLDLQGRIDGNVRTSKSLGSGQTGHFAQKTFYIKSTDFEERNLTVEDDEATVNDVHGTSNLCGAALAQVAHALVLSKPAIASPIVGAAKARHLNDAVATVDIQLGQHESAQLEEECRPYDVAGSMRRRYAAIGRPQHWRMAIGPRRSYNRRSDKSEIHLIVSLTLTG
jgi:aryl-alcohol dehydrogenase-like predicted oxidoreductase